MPYIALHKYNILQQVETTTDAYLVYFTDKDFSNMASDTFGADDAALEHLFLRRITRQLSGPLKVGYIAVANLTELTPAYRPPRLPHLVFYPNFKIYDEKLNDSAHFDLNLAEKSSGESLEGIASKIIAAFRCEAYMLTKSGSFRELVDHTVAGESKKKGLIYWVESTKRGQQ